MYIYDKVTQNDLNKYGLFLSQNFKLKQDVILSGIVQVTEYCNMYLTDFEEVSDGILVNEDTLLHLVDGIDGVLYEIFIKSNDKYRVYAVSCGEGESKTINIGDLFADEVIFNPITYYILYDGSVVVSDTVLLSVAGTGDVIQSGDSVTVTALLSQGNVGVSGVVLDYSIVHDDTTISSGTVTTDSNGEATISYTGTGIGEVTVTVSYGSLLTETYKIYDCLLVQTGKTTGWYNSPNVVLVDNRLKWTVPSSNQYFGVRGTNTSSLFGKTVTTHITTEFEKRLLLTVYVAVDGGWVLVNSAGINSGTQTTDLTSEIPSSATNVWIRLQQRSSSDLLEEGDEVYVDEWYIYED